MRFSILTASLAVGALGALGFVAGCGEEAPPPATEANCNLPATCVASDPACVAIADNKDMKQFGLRMSQILISKPAVLGPTTTVGGVVTGGVALDRLSCYQNGSGLFSWLLYFDTDAKTVCTGGAKPPLKPEDGYSFVNEPVLTVPISPIKFTSDLAGGKFTVPAGQGQDVVVPIFTAEGDPVLLPLKKARIIDGQLSPNNNCVGTFNAAGLDPYNNCFAFPQENQNAYNNAGKIEGHIRLEDADEVVISILSASLCTILTGTNDNGMTVAKCVRDANGKIDFKGDWCDATDAAADATCSDSVQLSAEFAASAVKINGGCPLP